MSVVFPSAEIYQTAGAFLLGALISTVFLFGVYIWNLHRQMDTNIPQKQQKPKIHEDLTKIGLSRRSEEILISILEEPKLQSDLADNLGVSSATVSKAISELNDRKLIKKRKKGQTYLIEPEEENIQEEIKGPESSSNSKSKPNTFI